MQATQPPRSRRSQPNDANERALLAVLGDAAAHPRDDLAARLGKNLIASTPAATGPGQGAGIAAQGALWVVNVVSAGVSVRAG